MECLLIADDLTGACDAAVQFAGRGRHVSVALDPDGFADSGVVAVSTESRGLGFEEARGAIGSAARRLSGYSPRILFKKIDSTLRGNAGAEIAAAVSAFGCDLAVITPAFPAMKRTVVDGWLRVEGPGEFDPVELEPYFRAQGFDCRRHIVTDAVCDADLDAVVEAMRGSKARILWAGSAGLAAALARSISMDREPKRLQHGTAPVLFCIGSTHAATVAQQRRLAAERPVREVSAEWAAAAEVADALREGRHVVLHVPRGRISEARIAELLPPRKACGALALSGGDTAAHICRALRAHGIELHDEVSAGIPWGTLRGGTMDGIAVVTKSGGFGDSGALIHIADFFTCPKV